MEGGPLQVSLSPSIKEDLYFHLNFGFRIHAFSAMTSTALSLLQTQCVVPEVINSVPIEHYLQIADEMYAFSRESREISMCYVSLKRFIKFVTNLLMHNSINKQHLSKKRRFLESAVRTCLQELETVVETIKAHEVQTKEPALVQEVVPEVDDEYLFDLLESGEPVVPVSSVTGRHETHTVDSDTVFIPPPAGKAEAVDVPTFMPKLSQTVPVQRDRASVTAAFDLLRSPEDKKCASPSAPYPTKPASESYVATNAHIVPKFVVPDRMNADDNASRKFQNPRTEIWPSHSTQSSTAFVSEDEFKIPGVKEEDAQIVRFILERNKGNIHLVDPGKPFCTRVVFESVDGSILPLVRDDFYVSFAQVLCQIPPQLQISRSAVETNRCFFLHLGIGISVHPFLLQTVFRYLTNKLLLESDADDWSLRQDILPSVTAYSGLVDANAFMWLWLEEFRPYRVCVLSGSQEKPILSTFRTRGSDPKDNQDLLLHCDGQHFTLLRPCVPPGQSLRHIPSQVPELIRMVQVNGGIVQQHQVSVLPGHSLSEVLARI